MDTKKMCKLFFEGDSYFNGKDVNTQKINNEVTIKGYCRNDSCKTNEDGINALAAYIYMKFKSLIIIEAQHNNYDEYLLMWISDKLFKMYHESKGENKKKGFVYLITLNQAYEEYLEKYKQRWNFWDLLNMMQGLKEANLKYMSEFYKLLNKICNTIVDYEKNSAPSKKLYNNSNGCRIQYRTLYRNIPKCKSYLNLLNKLKGIYDDFRDSAIKKNSSNNDLKTKLKKLTLGNGEEMDAVRGFKTYKFSDSKCKFPPKKPTPSKPSKHNSGSPSTTKIQRGSPVSQGVSNSTGDQLSNQEDTSKGSDSDQHNPAGQIKEQGGDTSDKPDQPQDGQQEKSGSKQANPIDVPKNGKEMKTPQANVPSTSTKSPSQGASEDPKKTETGDKDSPIPPQIKDKQGKSSPSGPPAMPSKELQKDNSQQSHQTTDSHIPGGALTPSDSESKDTDNIKEPKENKQGTVGDEQKDLGGGIGNETSTPSDPSNPNDNTQTSSTNQGGGSVGSGSGIEGTNSESKGPDNGSDGGSDCNKVSQEGSGGSKSGQGVKDSESGGSGSEPQGSNGERKDTGNDPSNKDGAQGDQGNSVDGPDNGQVTTGNGTESTDGGQGDKGGPIDGSGGDQGSPGSGSGGDKGNQDGSEGKGGEPPTPNGPSPPQKDSNQQNPPQQNSSQTSSETSTKSNEQTQEQRQSQDTSGNQNYDQKSQEEHQKPGVNPVIIPEHPGSEVKGNVITEIGDEYVLKKYKKIGISIIVILIPITLTILYKYLSSGWRKELTRKKNMKKVINSIGGKKQIQIIIKSSSRKKQTKKSINSVHRKKPSLLNIYKIMQADPVPFINLFFLLIFFVYKRKSDFLEL
ncbi:hypothetical protein YYE_03742 [Plasmodium vinckei vinckei]|uniref:CIR protein PIR protein n=1 Tax=Plasmodium vinckei vinckei TaxID=54757 RepID=A0A081ID84_PLAVN|nr:hypothetical protein YYE_03742 [Plasmodium vinckei vinckei]